MFKKRKKILIIGRLDKADFPKLDLENIEVKIDTGAYTSAIHCHNIREEATTNGTYLCFNLLDPSHPEYNEKEIRLKKYDKTTVKSSTGHTEDRFVIKTKIILFGKTYSVSLTLSDRKDMKYPILIGRKLLLNKFVVDVSRVNASFDLKSKRQKKYQILYRLKVSNLLRQKPRKSNQIRLPFE